MRAVSSSLLEEPGTLVSCGIQSVRQVWQGQLQCKRSHGMRGLSWSALLKYSLPRVPRAASKSAQASVAVMIAHNLLHCRRKVIPHTSSQMSNGCLQRTYFLLAPVVTFTRFRTAGPKIATTVHGTATVQSPNLE